MRGNRGLYVGVSRAKRSIPACAGEPSCLQVSSRRITVYPRVCGGTVAHMTSITTAQGLSPRVRGNLMQQRPNPRLPGLSPCLDQEDWTGLSPRVRGNPGRSWTRRRSCRVYPRVCGGTSVNISSSPALNGLSPRVRGNLAHNDLENAGKRSIPACAGEPAPR